MKKNVVLYVLIHVQVEDEIQTLRQVLLAKEKNAMDIRRRLGKTPLDNIRQNLARGWQDVQTSST